MLDELQPIDDVAGLDRLDRDARIGRGGAQAVGAQRERLAQGEDELVDLGQRMAVVQPALQAVAEQRAEALAVADALEHAEGEAHPLGGQVDRERVGPVARRVGEVAGPEGKDYQLREKIAVLLVRPRGWHLPEKHMLIDGKPVSGSLFDFGLYFFHNAMELMARGSGPYFYLPKMESHLEARLWNDVFKMAQDELGIPQGTIRATVLIETIPAAFEMDEILYELREHSAGLNCGRWDYIFSCIKKFRNKPDFLLADRAQITMTTHFMRSYSLLCIKTCHRRNIFAMGGMAAQIPVKNDPKLNEEAFAKVRADKEREARDGHDGTWVAHPGMVQLALDAFDAMMPQPNQIEKKREDVRVTAEDLLDFRPSEPITEQGLRTNVSVGVQYLAAWLGGSGAVPIFNLMEDAATAEISRAQVWQWIRHPRGCVERWTQSDEGIIPGGAGRGVREDQRAWRERSVSPPRDTERHETFSTKSRPMKRLSNS